MPRLHLFQSVSTPDSSRQTLEASRSVIQRDPQLLIRLEEEHMELLERYGHLQQLFNQGDFAGVKRALADLMHALHDHSQHENLKLYAPLLRRCQATPATLAAVRDCQTQMSTLMQEAIALFNVLGGAVRPAQIDEIQSRLNHFGIALTRCIENEESRVFPLCRAPRRSEP